MLFNELKKILAILLILICNITIAQKLNIDPTGDARWARAFFLAGDYINAMKEYELVLKKDTSDPDYYYNLGICYLNTTIDKQKAVYYLEIAETKLKANPDLYYELARAYQYVYRFDDAIRTYKLYQEIMGNSDPNYITAEMQIEMCLRAQELMKTPLNVSFENMGAKVNSPYPDYNPYITKNENALYYTSKRAGNIGNLPDFDGYYTPDLFCMESKYGAWDKPKRMPTMINSPLVEEMAGLSADGSYIYLFVDNFDVKFQVLYAVKSGKSFKKMESLGPNLQIKNQGVTAVTLYPNKKRMIFAAERNDCIGGSDLFYSSLLPDGDWGPAENLGDVINTEWDEDYPFLSVDGKTLYFSSIGHGSMGGYDIYKSVWDENIQQWSKPVNIGYPVNTPDDDMMISFTGSGRYGYMAALRPEGYGNLDIYRLTFYDVPPAYTVVRCNLQSVDSVSVYEHFREKYLAKLDSLNQLIDSVNIIIKKFDAEKINSIKEKIYEVENVIKKGPKASIQAINIADSSLFGVYKPNSITGKFVAALHPGTYSLIINIEGYAEKIETVTIKDAEMSQKEINRNIVLKPKK